MAKAPLLVKVCGMRDPVNIQQVVALGPDFLGFNFYAASSRYVGSDFSPEVTKELEGQVKRVGVFVDCDVEEMLDLVCRYYLDAVQLHGDEGPAVVAELKTRATKSIQVIKAFGVLDKLPPQLAAFEDAIDYVLFDKATPKRGGSGRRFDWALLRDYHGKVPALIAGGVDAQGVAALREIAASGANLVGIDVNSRVEEQPGLKSIPLLQEVFSNI